MIDQTSFLDVFHDSLRKHGEELCGDKVKTVRTDTHTIVVLSDGLGSGVKANILATLTSEILVNMLLHEVPLEDVIETVIGTQPVCKVRRIAYATFTVILLDNRDLTFRVINYDNPPVFHACQSRIRALPGRTEEILGKKIQVSEGALGIGDFLGVISDGVMYAGLGTLLNYGWGWDKVAHFLEGTLQFHSHSARSVVRSVLLETNRLYQGQPGDDATFLGIYARKRNSTMVFTGPPLEMGKDESYVQQFLNFPGRRVVCGGTTANIVGTYLGEVPRVDMATLHREVPPIGSLSAVDLVTEGILTMSKCLELIQNCDADLDRIPYRKQGDSLLARELLEADYVHFLVGQRINEFYQNPLLPQRISIRRSLVDSLAQILRAKHKQVTIEFC